NAAGPVFVVVLGGPAPAATTAALGLSRLGYRTAVVDGGRSGISRRRSSRIEGLSQRALASLSESGLGSCTECASEPAARLVYWAGQSSGRGQEFLIEREEVDARLQASVRNSAVNWIDASVRSSQLVDEVWHIQTTRGSVCSRTVLDARGRYARRSDSRGPLLVAWNITRRCGGRGPRGSAVAALDDGWCW